uniref:Uncharacterized protein n=1 Tax=Rhizophora mucronata TaxID=61149 RepID=A0A2P2QWE6_RHIMU
MRQICMCNQHYAPKQNIFKFNLPRQLIVLQQIIHDLP